MYKSAAIFSRTSISRGWNNTSVKFWHPVPHTLVKLRSFWRDLRSGNNSRAMWRLLACMCGDETWPTRILGALSLLHPTSGRLCNITAKGSQDYILLSAAMTFTGAKELSTPEVTSRLQLPRTILMHTWILCCFLSATIASWQWARLAGGRPGWPMAQCCITSIKTNQAPTMAGGSSMRISFRLTGLQCQGNEANRKTHALWVLQNTHWCCLLRIPCNLTVMWSTIMWFLSHSWEVRSQCESKSLRSEKINLLHCCTCLNHCPCFSSQWHFFQRSE